MALAVAQVDGERALPRTRAAIAAVGGVVMPLVQAGAAMPGFGLQAEVGTVLEDRLSIVARLTGFTNIGAWDLGGAAALDYALSERLALGAGVGAKLFFGLESGSLVSVMVPVRITFAPWARKPDQVARSGLLLGLEVAGGVAVFATRGRRVTFAVPAPALSALLSIGYALW